MEDFLERIDRLNQVMELPCNDTPTDLGEERLLEFNKILHQECCEIADCLVADDRVVALADLLGDIVVYCASEARRWGIPLLQVLHIIMDSQDSKLVDGKPVPSDLPGKFGKGPNYEPPERRIAMLLGSKMDHLPQEIKDAVEKVRVDSNWYDNRFLCRECRTYICGESVRKADSKTRLRCPECGLASTKDQLIEKGN